MMSLSFLSSLHGYADLGLLVLRVAIGVIFLYHCKGKLKGNMGGFMTFIGAAELAGGLALVLGVLTELAALGLAIIMVGAIWKKTQEWHVPFSAQDKMGWEFDLALLAGCIALMTLGPGALAVL